MAETDTAVVVAAVAPIGGKETGAVMSVVRTTLPAGTAASSAGLLVGVVAPEEAATEVEEDTVAVADMVAAIAAVATGTQ